MNKDISSSTEHSQEGESKKSLKRNDDLRVLPRLLWFIRILLAIAFALAGFMKLIATPDMVSMFDTIGFGQWFRYFTGIVEISGAILLLTKKTKLIGTGILLVTMVVAMGIHLFVIGGSAIPAFILFSLLCSQLIRR
uniref:DoxX family protein n=1 Tax=Ningiella ruwaisensis TaxID=2364274 RepID=UPI0019D551BA|nr:DoxX family protein [Ningiella ruwaisensis]